MNFEQYRVGALRTEAPLLTRMARLNHAALGMITEIGEATSEIKRISIYGKKLDDLCKDGKTTLRQHIAEEIGDALWYIAIADDVLEGEKLSFSVPPEDDELTMDWVVRRAAKHVGTFVDFVDDCEEAAYRQVQRVSLHYILNCLTKLANLIGYDIQRIAADNLDKLQKRYPEKFTQELAEARLDKDGEDHRNS